MRQDVTTHTPDLRSAAILLVEDDENDIALMTRAFRNAHIVNPLNVVKDGEEAIKYLAGEGSYAERDRYPMPFLVLLDLRLPKLSGFEVLEWVRDQDELSELIVVILTVSDHVPDVKKAHDLGANSYLIKPDSFEELVQMVKQIEGRWLELKRLPEPTTPQEANPPTP